MGKKMKKKKSDPMASVGAPGYAIYSGYLQTKEKDRRLRGTTKYVTYRDILANTSIVSAGVRYFVNLVAKASWTVQPADDSPEAAEMAQRVEVIIGGIRTPWARIVRRTAMGRFYGFSVQEWTMRRGEDGYLVYDDIAPRPQATIERWDVDPDGTVQGMVQRVPQTQMDVYLPRGKTIYYVDDTLDDSPEGLGLFRHLVKLADKLSQLELLEAWGYERDLRGTPVGRAPLVELEKMVKSGKITRAQADALVEPLNQWIEGALRGKGTSLLLDSATYRAGGDNESPSSIYQFDLDLLQGEGGPHEALAAAIERINREMARILGVEQLLLGADSKGSHALAQDKTQSFGLLVDSTLREIRELYERDFLSPLWELNGWDQALKPSFQTSQAQYRDVEQLSRALKDMATAGAPLMPDDPAINEVRDLLGLSAAPEEDMLAEEME